MENGQALQVKNQSQEFQTRSVEDIVSHVNLIQRVMEKVMKKDVHYGVIPGCGTKPALLKAGAEKIAEAFRLAPDIEVTERRTEDEIAFTIKVCLRHQGTGAFIGSGVGECSTSEEKYKWKKAFNEKEFFDMPDNRRRTKWIKSYGKEIEIKQIRTNPADLANTVLKMAKKRALVDAVLTATSASDIFVQDVDESVDVQDQSQTPKDTPETMGSASSGSNTQFVSDPQRKRFYAICKHAGKEDEEIKKHLFDRYGLESTKEITRDIYEELCVWGAEQSVSSQLVGE